MTSYVIDSIRLILMLHYPMVPRYVHRISRVLYEYLASYLA